MQPTEEHPEAQPAAGEPAARKPARLRDVASAVFWSFFGVRKGRHMLQDMESIKPLYVVIVGLAAGLAFVLLLVAIVTVIMRTAGQAG